MHDVLHAGRRGRSGGVGWWWGGRRVPGSAHAYRLSHTQAHTHTHTHAHTFSLTHACAGFLDAQGVRPRTGCALVTHTHTHILTKDSHPQTHTHTHVSHTHTNTQVFPHGDTAGTLVHEGSEVTR